MILALEALNAADYAHAYTLTNEAIEQGISWDIGKAEALNLRGTFKFLMTDVDGAKADFLASLELQPSMTQTWVKIASVWMEQGDPTKAFECFEEAIKYNAADPDIYYHRGQGALHLRHLYCSLYKPLTSVCGHLCSTLHYERVHRSCGELHQVDGA